MKRRDDRRAGAEAAVVPDDDGRVVLHGQVEVAEEALADGRVAAVVDVDRPLQKAVRAQRGEQCAQDFAALRGVVLKRGVVARA